ncbi:YlcI/YnfO family protein [Aeromicrobium sp. CTD01-1L150]|uniref:YlcI/YnfO family protein n=1 Tax=Aeromicrobium sp. CTD01-1L150 TaxID=3341830 RepID=UPI0035BF1EDB
MSKYTDAGYVDLDREVVRDKRGERITESDAEARSAEVIERNKGGRPSLTGSKSRTPALAVRVPDEVRDKLSARAEREGKSLSQVVRETLEASV